MTDTQTKDVVLFEFRRLRLMREEQAADKAYRTVKRVCRWLFQINFRLLRFRYALYIDLRRNYCSACSENTDLREGPLWRLPWMIYDILRHETNSGHWGIHD